MSFCIQGNKGLLNVVMSVLSCTVGRQKWKPLLSSRSQMSTLSRAFQTSAIKYPKYTQTSSKRRALSFESFRGDIRPCRFFPPESSAAHKLNYSLGRGERSEACSNCPNFKCNDMSEKNTHTNVLGSVVSSFRIYKQCGWLKAQRQLPLAERECLALK